MKTLRLADHLTLPLDAVSRTFGILAVRGAGKSNTAAVMAEEMFAAGLPFVVIDPVGSWYGLRSSADGTRPGLAVPIFGGKHGDVPLERGAGARRRGRVTGAVLGGLMDGPHHDPPLTTRDCADYMGRSIHQKEKPVKKIQILLVAVLIAILAAVSASAQGWIVGRTALVSFEALYTNFAFSSQFTVAYISDRNHAAQTCVMVIRDTTTGYLSATAVHPDSCRP